MARSVGVLDAEAGTRAARLRSRRFLKAIVPGTLLLAFLAMKPAIAEHKIQIIHQPPPAAAGGLDFAVAAVVRTSCTSEASSQCDDLYVEFTHIDAAGVTRSTSRALTPYPAQPVTFAIPAVDVRVPSISYWLRVRQQQTLCGDCSCTTHEASDETPVFTVPVMAPAVAPAAEAMPTTSGPSAAGPTIRVPALRVPEVVRPPVVSEREESLLSQIHEHLKQLPAAPALPST